MAFKDTLIWIIESFITHNVSRYTVSCTPKKKFSDLVEYTRKNEFGKSLAGNTRKDTDTGHYFTYEYNFGGDGSRRYEVRIKHTGEIVHNLELEYRDEGAACVAKDAIARMEKKLPDYEGNVAEEVPVVSYSANTLSELIALFDKNLNEFAKNPSASTFSPLLQLKASINDKINELPLAQRAPYGAPLSNIQMYLDALKMQINTGVGGTQFVGTYVPQIATSLAELAALVG